jgi:hypothetical protein
VVGRRCSICHADPPVFGAPVPLMKRAHFEAASLLEPGKKIHETMKARLNSGDGDLRMPADRPLDAADLDTLNAWLDGGRPSTGACDAVEARAQVSDVAGVENLPCEPETWVVATDGAEDGYAVPAQTDKYFCFGKRLDATKARQLVAGSPVLDSGLIHHMILYVDNEPFPEGPHTCNDMDNSAVPVMMWGPGAGNLALPGDVGLKLPRGTVQFVLEVHYNNALLLPGKRDRSGFAVCTTDSLRAKEAAISTLGTLDFTIPAGGSLSLENTCAADFTEPVHILGSAPHMHEIGRSMKSVIVRGHDGSEEVLVDVPYWSFDNQRGYAVNRVLEPGDKIRTRCTWENPTGYPVHFGGRTQDEMCFNFVLYYPAGLLKIPGEYADACIDLLEVLSHGD